jgi:hypothetical protein
VPWDSFYASFARGFRQGDHVTILGPTRSGKTHLGLRIIELRSYVLFLATKPRDPLISALRRDGYRIQSRLEVRRDPDTGRPVDRRIVYWPIHGSERERHELSLRALRDLQAAHMRHAFTYAYRSGGWCVFADETIWLADDLKLKDELDMLLYQGRTLGVSMICAGQRPAWVPRACYSQADHIFLFQTNDRDDILKLADIGGSNVERIRAVVPTLSPQEHEFLYIGTRTNILLRSAVEQG